MKKVLSIIAITIFTVSMTAGVGFTEWGDGDSNTTGGSFVINGQGQLQNSGGLAGSNGQVSGFIGGYGGAQTQYGAGVGFFGKASDWQTQGQGSNDSVGSFTGTGWNTIQTQNGGGKTTGLFGGYEYTGSQAQIGGAAGVSYDGRIGVAGSGYAGFQQSQASAIKGESSQSNYQGFEGGYGIKSGNVTPNGYRYVYQSGTQSVEMGTSAWSGCGGGEASTGVIQAGGTLALNNGNATAMYGSGSAASIGTTSSNHNGESFIDASQTHNYEQKVVDGGNWQYQSGSVSTSIGAGQQPE